MKFKLFLCFMLCGFLLSKESVAQPDNYNHWVQYSGSYWFSPSWVVTANLQYRTYDPIKNPRVIFTGAEGSYNFKEAPISFTAGYAHLFNRNYVTAEETEFTHENRLYQAINIRGNLGKVGLTHRYQVEERWLAQGYHTRFRYLVALKIPLGDKEQEVRPWYGILRNEVRVIVREQPFDSNRIFGGLGYTFSKHLTLEGMWMSQLHGAGTKHQHFTMFTLRHDFGRRE